MDLAQLTVVMHFFLSPSYALEYKWMNKSLPDGVTEEEKQFLLNVHNFYRRSAAQGGIIGDGPQAANMKELVWNSTLANDAQAWSAVCGNTLHNDKKERGYSGQNIILYTDRRVIMKMGMLLWADKEAKDYYKYSSKNYHSKAGHFTQIIWARSHQIGCGYSRCQGYQFGRLVCHFMPPGNYDFLSTHRRGQPCSQCDPGFGFCNDKLCARSCTGDKCRCAVDRNKCIENGGKFDHQKCFCQCSVGATGLNCGETCQDHRDMLCEEAYCQVGTKYYHQGEALCPSTCFKCEAVCKNFRKDCKSLTQQGSCITHRRWMKRFCPKSCNLCPRRGKCNETSFNCKSPELQEKCKTSKDDKRCPYYYGCCFRAKNRNDGTSFQTKPIIIVSLNLLIHFLLSSIICI